MSMNDANSKASPRDSSSSWDDEDDGISLSELAGAILGQWKIILAGSVLAGAAGLGAASLMKPVFTARTSSSCFRIAGLWAESPLRPIALSKAAGFSRMARMSCIKSS